MPWGRLWAATAAGSADVSAWRGGAGARRPALHGCPFCCCCWGMTLAIQSTLPRVLGPTCSARTGGTFQQKGSQGRRRAGHWRRQHRNTAPAIFEPQHTWTTVSPSTTARRASETKVRRPRRGLGGGRGSAIPDHFYAPSRQILAPALGSAGANASTRHLTAQADGEMRA